MVIRKWYKVITLFCIIGLILQFFYPTLSVHANVNSSEPEEKVYVNQSGYNFGQPKRFTAPLAKDESTFDIIDVETLESVYKGTFSGQVGDFSDFEPEEVGEYIIEVEGEQSVPFSIEPY